MKFVCLFYKGVKVEDGERRGRTDPWKEVVLVELSRMREERSKLATEMERRKCNQEILNFSDALFLKEFSSIVKCLFALTA